MAARNFWKKSGEPGSAIDVAPEDNPTNEPEPDLIVLKREFANFQLANPRSADLHLAIEIADTSLPFDLTVKAALYARADIADYWVLDVQGRRLIVHRDPVGGKYGNVVAYGADESVVPIAAPDCAFAVARAFPE